MSESQTCLTSGTGERIAYNHIHGAGPCLVFLGGFMSDMSGVKAMALDEHMKAQGRSFIRFDYRGHGASEGSFDTLCLGDWTKDALQVIDVLAGENVILAGSSMGGWIALHAAMKRAEKVKGFIGIAAAPDFTYELYNHHLSPAQVKKLNESGRIEIPAEFGHPYIITKKLVEESARHLLMSYEELPVEVPVRLIHGMKDAQVPWTTALRIAEKVTSPDVRIILEKDGDHRLSSESNICLLLNTVDEMFKLVEGD